MGAVALLKCRKFIGSICLILIVFTSSAYSAEDRPKFSIKAFELESLRIIGSDRITTSQLSESLGIQPGIKLNDEFVMTAREKLLSLGLFRSVILSMRKGSQKGKALLVVRLEDDPNVLGDWAFGGKLKIAQGEVSTNRLDPDTPPLGYKIDLLGRNLFSSLYRGAVSVDIDSIGKIRAGRIALGLPRFAQEDLQFDFDVTAIDPRHRFLDVLGFGGKMYGNWTQSISDYSNLEYGMAMYVNRGPEFALPNFPKSLAGPRMAWVYESRLQRFFPDSGSKVGVGLLYAPIERKHSVSELSLAHTLSLGSSTWFTVSSDLLGVGTEGYSARGGARFDVSLNEFTGSSDQAGLYFELKGGRDRFSETDLEGSAAIIGLKYHSQGFIAELSFQITKTPDELDSPELRNVWEAK